MGIRTHVLFHFTKQIAAVQNILRTGVFWPSYSLEDLSWIGGKPLNTAFPMVSFCDIPISRIEEHTSYYGEYGIGLTQDWGKASGLNPILYINDKSTFSRELHNAVITVMDKDEETQKEKAESERNWENMYRAMHLLAYTKPMIGSAGKNKGELKDFYAESEWRYIPPAVMTTELCYLHEKDFDKAEVRRTRNDKVIEKGPLAFSITDIRYLFVKTVSEIPFLIDFINSNLGQYPANHLKILISRIFSLEELRSDI